MRRPCPEAKRLELRSESCMQGNYCTKKNSSFFKFLELYSPYVIANDSDHQNRSILAPMLSKTQWYLSTTVPNLPDLGSQLRFIAYFSLPSSRQDAVICTSQTSRAGHSMLGYCLGHCHSQTTLAMPRSDFLRGDGGIEDKLRPPLTCPLILLASQDPR